MDKHSLCLDKLSLSPLTWSCLNYFLMNSDIRWNHLHLGKLDNKAQSLFNHTFKSKVLEVALLPPIHYVPSFCLYGIQECYVILEGCHHGKMIQGFFGRSHLRILHITMGCPIVLHNDCFANNLQKSIENNSTIQEFYLEFSEKAEITTLTSVITGVSKNETITSFSLVAKSLDHLIPVGTIEDLLKNNEMLQCLSLDIPDGLLDLPMNINEVKSPLTALKVTGKKLMALLFPHTKQLHCLLLPEPYQIDSIFHSHPSLHTLTLPLDTVERSTKLFNTLQTNTTLKGLRVAINSLIFTSSNLCTSLEDMLKQNKTLQSFELTSEGLLNIHVPVSFLSSLQAGIVNNTSIKELSVPIPLSSHLLDTVNSFLEVVTKNVSLIKCHIDLRLDESYQNSCSDYEEIKQEMASLYKKLQIPNSAVLRILILGQKYEDLKTNNVDNDHEVTSEKQTSQQTYYTSQEEIRLSEALIDTETEDVESRKRKGI